MADAHLKHGLYVWLLDREQLRVLARALQSARHHAVLDAPLEARVTAALEARRYADLLDWIVSSLADEPIDASDIN